MACTECVDATQIAESLIQENMRLKRTNKVLRTVNGQLRRYVTSLHNNADGVFLTICTEAQSAELALGELWGSGEFDCGPQDYETIVETCVARMRGQTEAPQEPKQTSI